MQNECKQVHQQLAEVKVQKANLENSVHNSEKELKRMSEEVNKSRQANKEAKFEADDDLDNSQVKN